MYDWAGAVLRFGLVCGLVAFFAVGCGDREAERRKAEGENREQLRKDAVAWADTYGAIAGWEDRVGSFSLQVEDALIATPTKRLLIYESTLTDVVRHDSAYYIEIEPRSLGGTLRFVLSCSESLARDFVDRSNERARLQRLRQRENRTPEEFSEFLEALLSWDLLKEWVVDAVVEIAAVQRVTSLDISAAEDGFGPLEEVSSKRFVASGALIAHRIRTIRP